MQNRNVSGWFDVIAMFGWILKTDWDIDRISRAYSIKRIKEASMCLDEEAQLS